MLKLKYIATVIASLLLTGCSMAQPKAGDLVVFKYDKYNFIKNTFLNKQADCMYTGAIENELGVLDAYYCAGRNYANQLNEGFIFKNTFDDFTQRIVGAKLLIESTGNKKSFTLSCVSHTLNPRAQEGVEYTVCMTPFLKYNLYGYLKETTDVSLTLAPRLGKRRLYIGTVSEDGKKLVEYFYKNVSLKNKKSLKSEALWETMRL